MSKRLNSFLGSLNERIFKNEFVTFMTNEEADELMGNTNWNFIYSVVDEFSEIVENHGIDDAIDIYRQAYDDELGLNDAEKMSTEYSLVLLGMSMQDHSSEEIQ